MDFLTAVPKSFDTHAAQIRGRQYRITGLGEALYAFQQDLKRIGRDKNAALMMFSEFGRRVEENAGGTVMGRLLQQAFEPGGSRRQRRPEDDGRLPARVRDHDPAMSGL